MITTSNDAFLSTSCNPSCSRNAVDRSGATGTRASPSDLAFGKSLVYLSVKSYLPVSPVLSRIGRSPGEYSILANSERGSWRFRRTSTKPSATELRAAMAGRSSGRSGKSLRADWRAGAASAAVSVSATASFNFRPALATTSSEAGNSLDSMCSFRRNRSDNRFCSITRNCCLVAPAGTFATRSKYCRRGIEGIPGGVLASRTTRRPSDTLRSGWLDRGHLECGRALVSGLRPGQHHGRRHYDSCPLQANGRFPLGSLSQRE